MHDVALHLPAQRRVGVEEPADDVAVDGASGRSVGHPVTLRRGRPTAVRQTKPNTGGNTRATTAAHPA